MKVKECVDERIESINKYLNSNEVDPGTITDNKAILDILYKVRYRNIKEIKQVLEELEIVYDTLSYKEGYEDRCNELVQQIGVLKNILFLCDEYKKDDEITRWRAEKEKEYFFITGTSEITTDEEHYNETDNARYELGNYFQTEKQAKKVTNSKEWKEFWRKIRNMEIRVDEE